MTPEAKTSFLQPSITVTITSANIPIAVSPVFCRIALKHIMHNFRGAFGASTVCMDDSICTKRHSKECVEGTEYHEPRMKGTYRLHAPSDSGETVSCTYRLDGGAQVTGTINNS